MCWPLFAPVQVFWFVGQFPTVPYLECSLQIIGREEVAGENKDPVLPDSARILGHTPSPLVRARVSCDLAETLRPAFGRGCAVSSGPRAEAHGPRWVLAV